jgi:hypothetical protein
MIVAIALDRTRQRLAKRHPATSGGGSSIMPDPASDKPRPSISIGESMVLIAGIALLSWLLFAQDEAKGEVAVVGYLVVSPVSELLLLRAMLGTVPTAAVPRVDTIARAGAAHDVSDPVQPVRGGSPALAGGSL